MEQSWVDGVARQAQMDALGQYRYNLVRIWEEHQPRVCFVMLNPSTADAYQDDPTIRRCIGFARAWGYGSLEVVNLYAWRATDPKEIWKATFPIGSENDRYIDAAVKRSSCVIAAWGVGAKCRARVGQVNRILVNAYCLGRTKKGDPRHPLFIPANHKPSLYLSAGAITK
jgi:hypothetical protein